MGGGVQSVPPAKIKQRKHCCRYLFIRIEQPFS
nr:MAG TPA: hypothetical protein [Bacteriophage sp.]